MVGLNLSRNKGIPSFKLDRFVYKNSPDLREILPDYFNIESDIDIK